MQKAAQGAYTTAPVIMTGDSPNTNPSAGGALPELVYNPTHAPLAVQPNPKTQQAMSLAQFGIQPRMKAPRFAAGTRPGGDLFAAYRDSGREALGNQLRQQLAQIHAGGIQPGGLNHPAQQAYQPGQYAHQPAQPAPYVAPPPVLDAGVLQMLQNEGYGNAPTSSQNVAANISSAYANPNPYAAQPNFAVSPYTPYPSSYSPAPQAPLATTASSMAGMANTLRQMPPTNYQQSPPPTAGSGLYQQLSAQPAAQPAGQWASYASAYSGGMPRFAVGTDNSAAYANAGMGSSWLPSAANGGVPAGTYLPNNLQALANYGVPLPPALVAANTGGIASPVNMGNAYQSLGGGVAPSLQTLNAETPGEQGLQQSYTQGVTGIPWDDFVKALSQPTANLTGAPNATGQGF